jgi:hypothetical protein
MYLYKYEILGKKKRINKLLISVITNLKNQLIRQS